MALMLTTNCPVFTSVSPAASAASAAIRSISRADTTVKEPWLVFERKSPRVFFRSGSATLSIGSFSLILSTVTTRFPPTVGAHPEAPQYTEPTRISSRWFTSNPISVVTVFAL